MHAARMACWPRVTGSQPWHATRPWPELPNPLRYVTPVRDTSKRGVGVAAAGEYPAVCLGRETKAPEANSTPALGPRELPWPERDGTLDATSIRVIGILASNTMVHFPYPFLREYH